MRVIMDLSFFFEYMSNNPSSSIKMLWKKFL